MPKATRGFITSDGVFFNREADAVLYETRLALENRYNNSMGMHATPFVVFLDMLPELHDETMAYLEALKNVQNLQQDEDAEKPAD